MSSKPKENKELAHGRTERIIFHMVLFNPKSDRTKVGLFCPNLNSMMPNYGLGNIILQRMEYHVGGPKGAAEMEPVKLYGELLHVMLSNPRQFRMVRFIINGENTQTPFFIHHATQTSAPLSDGMWNGDQELNSSTLLEFILQRGETILYVELERYIEPFVILGPRFHTGKSKRPKGSIDLDRHFRNTAKSENKKVNIAFGPLEPKISVQLRKQKFNFDSKHAEGFEKTRQAINQLRLGSKPIMGEATAKKMFTGLLKKIVAHVRQKNK